MSEAHPVRDFLSRRQALKTLATITGVAALTHLPSKWETPLVVVGALPAHAQGSAGTLAKIEERFVPSIICDSYFEWHARISYNVPAGGEALHYVVEFSGGAGGNAVLLFIEGEDDGITGELELTFCFDFGTHDQATLELWGTDLRGLETNHLIYHLTRPEPLAKPNEGKSTTERFTGSEKF